MIDCSVTLRACLRAGITGIGLPLKRQGSRQRENKSQTAVSRIYAQECPHPVSSIHRIGENYRRKRVGFSNAHSADGLDGGNKFRNVDLDQRSEAGAALNVQVKIGAVEHAQTFADIAESDALDI